MDSGKVIIVVALFQIKYELQSVTWVLKYSDFSVC